METPGAVRAALERLREHTDLRPAGTLREQWIADLALVTAALDAGARAGEERARVIEECAKAAEIFNLAPKVNPSERIVLCAFADHLRALIPPAAPERGPGA